MLNKKIIFAWLIIISWPKFSLAQETTIIITEIAAYESSNFEWLEIYNNSASAVDLTGWKFYEDQTNHGLSAYQGDLIIEPQEYVIIADVATNFIQSYPNFTGTVIDSSWTTLNEAGEEIALKNAAAEIVESFTYLPCPDTSLQRINFNLADYTISNWQIHPTSNSAGRANEFPQPEILPEQPPVEDPIDPMPTEEPDIPAVPRLVTGSIIINELVADPTNGEPEWVELYNKNSVAIDLTGWQLIDGSGAITNLEQTINTNAYLIIENPKGKLNNSGDLLILKDDNQNTMDSVSYGNWQNSSDNAPVPLKPLALARLQDGFDSNQASDWNLTTTPTKNSANIITLAEKKIKNEETNDQLTLELKTETAPDIFATKKAEILITEIFPNPTGSDLNNEFIELFNTGNQEIDLLDWQITVEKNSYRFQQSLKIPPNQYYLLTRKTSGLALNNEQATIKLIAPDQKTQQKISYEQEISLTENNSYALAANNDWQWTTLVTPEQTNIISPLNQAPIISIYCPKQAITGELITCDASDSYDLENNQLQFSWQIAKQKFPGEIINYKFSLPGTYTLHLTVSDGQLASEFQHKIKITGSTIESAKKNPKKESASNVAEYQPVDLSQIRQIEPNKKIITHGVVTVLPNTFSKTIMYLNGLQLYFAKADWPDLQLGQLIQVLGTISQSKGETRLKIAKNADLIILGQDEVPLPQLIQIQDINETWEGKLIQVEAQLIEKQSSKFYVQDPTGEAEIAIKQNIKFNKKLLAEGDNLVITGIVSQNEETYQILPRSTKDIVKKEIIVPATITQVPARKTNQSIGQYLLALTIFLSLGTGVVYFQHKQKSSGRKQPTQS